MLEAMPQQVDHAALGDFTLKAGEKFLPNRTDTGQVQRLNQIGLGGFEKGGKLNQIDGELPVIVMPVAQDPADATIESGRFGHARSGAVRPRQKWCRQPMPPACRSWQQRSGFPALFL